MAYINREEFKRKLIDEKSFFPAIVARALEEMPDAAVEEVKHGEWDYIATHDCFSCNICKFDSDVVMKYCGGCGAKMDGGIHNG